MLLVTLISLTVINFSIAPKEIADKLAYFLITLVNHEFSKRITARILEAGKSNSEKFVCVLLLNSFLTNRRAIINWRVWLGT